jgi:hypothetical protein
MSILKKMTDIFSRSIQLTGLDLLQDICNDTK